MQYAKINNGAIEFAPKNKGSICNYNQDIERMKSDGYKEFETVERPVTNRYYHIEYEETVEKIRELIVYENTQEQADVREQQEKENEFNAQFFNTSLGYVRRNVTMKDGSIRNFLFDIKPNLKVNAPIITYTPNQDYANLTQNKNVLVTPQFLEECEQQILKDFYGE